MKRWFDASSGIQKENEMNGLSLFIGSISTFGAGYFFARHSKSGDPKTLPLAVALLLIGLIFIAAA